MMSRRILWNCALIVLGALYLGLVLFHEVESPVIGLAFVMLAGHEVIHTHRTHR